MAEPNALKILTSKPANNGTEKLFIENNDNSTYIEVPKTVVKTIRKIKELPVKHIFVDVLATAINKRRLEDISDVIDTWIHNDNKKYYYPMCDANRSFDKLISTFVRELCPTGLTEEEVKNLIFFFAKCPHGYDVTMLIQAHCELNPVIT